MSEGTKIGLTQVALGLVVVLIAAFVVRVLVGRSAPSGTAEALVGSVMACMTLRAAVLGYTAGQRSSGSEGEVAKPEC